MLAASAWAVAAGSAALSLGTFLIALRIPALAPPDAQRKTAILLLIGAPMLTVAAAVFLLKFPFVDWVLLAYPITGVLAWCGEIGLRNQQPRVRINPSGLIRTRGC